MVRRLRTTGMTRDELENHRKLTQRDGRFFCLSVLNPDSTVNVDQPSGGWATRPGTVFQLGYDGFCEAVCRVAR